MAEHPFHRTLHRRRRGAHPLGIALGRPQLLGLSYKVRPIHDPQFNHGASQLSLMIQSIRTALRGLTKATVFFLGLLSSSHPSPYLQSLSDSLIPILEDQPRLYQFQTEREFTRARRRWEGQVKTLRVELHHVPEDEATRSDGSHNWWNGLSNIVAILEGREEVLMKVIGELGGGWKEVCAAWGVFVDPRLRRQELP